MFSGFTVPKAVYFPPELRSLVREISTLSELKVTICLLDAYFQSGLDARPLTFDDIQDLTQLARSSVNDGIKRALKRGSIERCSINGTFKYEPALRGVQNDSSNSEPPCMSLNMDSLKTFSSKHLKESCMSESEISERRHLFDVIFKEFKLSKRVALDISERYDINYLWRHIYYTRHAVKQNQCRSTTGYFVARIRDDWAPPKGFSMMGYLEGEGYEQYEIYRMYRDGEVEIPELEDSISYRAWLSTMEGNDNEPTT